MKRTAFYDLNICIFFLLLCLVPCGNLVGQVQPHFIFKDRKVINSHSTETLNKRMLDFRVSHRFGDLAGDNGGWQTFYGLESASDVSIGFSYGITNNLTVGVHRSKGAGPLKQLVNIYAKYKIAGQNDRSSTPIALSILGYGTISTMPKSEEVTAINNFPKFLHRVAYHFQLILAKRFSPGFSLQVNGGYTHRNYVPPNDENYLLNLGGAARVQVSRSIAILLEGNYPIRFNDNSPVDYTAPLGLGLEWETGGGHVFQMNFTNATALSETDYLPYTSSHWGEGEFRFGFTISRLFRI